MKFEIGDKEWWVFITRQEWQFLYAVTNAREMMQEAPLGGDVDQAMRWLLHEIQSQHGYEFSGVTMSGNGELLTNRDEPVCQENVYFLLLLRDNIPPDIQVHTKAALAFAQDHLPEFDTSVLVEAAVRINGHAQQVEDATRRRVQAMSPEDQRAHIEAILTRDQLVAGALSLDGEEVH